MFKKYKFSSYDYKESRNKLETKNTHENYSYLDPNSLHPNIEDYIGVYTSHSVRELPTTKQRPLNLRDVNNVMKEYSKRISCHNAPVLFTLTERFGISGKNILPKVSTKSKYNFFTKK